MTRITMTLLLLCSCFSEQPISETDTSSSGSSWGSTGSTTTETTSSSSGTSTTGVVDESSSSGVVDESSSGDGSDSSSSGEPPIEDFALYFDGAATMQSTEDVALVLDGSFTVEAWLRLDSADAHGQLVTHRGAGTTGWELFITEGTTQIAFGVFDNNGEWTEATGDDVSVYGPGWHHVAGTKDGTSLLVHVDGELVATQSCPDGMGAPTVPLRVGTGESPLETVGVDDVRISAPARYDAAFDPEDELALDANTLVLVVLDEGIGQAADEVAMGLLFELEDATWIPGNTER